jgi:WD40 repeat protein
MGKPGVVKLWDVAQKKERAVLKTHKQPVLALAFSPDGKTLASGSAELKSNGSGDVFDLQHLDFLGISGKPDFLRRDGEIKLWHVESGVERPGFQGQPVLALGFLNDATLCASHPLGALSLYDISNTQKSKDIGQSGLSWSIAVHPRGRALTVSSGHWTSDGTVMMLRVTGAQVDASPGLRLPSAATACAFSPDGAILATAELGHTVRLWDWERREELSSLLGHTDVVGSVAFSSDGRLLATGGWDRTVKLWDTHLSREWIEVDASSTSYSVSFSPDGKQILTESGDKAKLWDSSTLALVASHASGRRSQWFASDGRLCWSEWRDGKLMLWREDQGPERPLGVLPIEEASEILVSPDLEYVAEATTQEQKVSPALRIWDVSTGSKRADLPVGLSKSGGYPPAYIKCWRFSPDGKLLAAGDWFHNLKVWDVGSGNERAGVWSQGFTETITFSPDGKALACGDNDGVIRLRNPNDLRETAKLQGGHHANIWRLAFSPDGRVLASADRSGRLALWDVATREERLILRGPRTQPSGLAFSPDGRSLAVGYNGRAVLFRGARDDEVHDP